MWLIWAMAAPFAGTDDGRPHSVLWYDQIMLISCHFRDLKRFWWWVLNDSRKHIFFYTSYCKFWLVCQIITKCLHQMHPLLPNFSTHITISFIQFDIVHIHSRDNFYLKHSKIRPQRCLWFCTSFDLMPLVFPKAICKIKIFTKYAAQ